MTIKYLNTSYLNKRYKLFGFTQPINDNFLPFELNTSISFANALRRVFISEIPILAFDPKNIKININTSKMNNEVLKKRLQLMVIKNNDKNKDLIFVIGDLNHPEKPIKNNSYTNLKIRTHDHTYIYNPKTNKKINTKSILPYNDILCILSPNEELNIIMKPSLGIGKQHPRWQSSITMYKFKTDKNLLSNNDQMKTKGKIIILTVESIGSMTSRDIITTGINILKRKLLFIKNQLNMDKSDIIKVIKTNMKTIFIIKDEDHTLGNILQEEGLNILGVNAINSLIAYKIPHPLEKNLEIHIKLSKNMNITVILFFNKIITNLIKICDNLQ